jgi:hypothetical protein
VPKYYKGHGRSLGAVEFRSSKGTVVWPEVVVEEELEVSLCRLIVLLEDLVTVRLF